MFTHSRHPAVRRSVIGRVLNWGVTKLDGAAATLRGASQIETLCMALGIGGMLLALGVTVAQATLTPLIQTEGELRKAVIAADFDDALCPDGWAADHAALLGMTEAEVSAWYLREAFELSDKDVITGAGLYLSNAKDFRMIEGPALTRNQILLCIAESRRLTQPIDELLPPHLRLNVASAL